MDEPKQGKGAAAQRRRWISLQPFVRAWGRGRQAWASAPRRALGRGGLILAGGAAICAAWSWGVSKAGIWFEPRGMGDWDQRVLGWIAEEETVGFTGAVLLESPGNAAYLVPLTVAVAVCLALRGKAFAGLAILVAYWGVRFLVGVGWAAWSRARPDLIADGIAAPGFHSFPSGHTALSAAAYGLLAYLWARAASSLGERLFAWALAAFWVVLIGLARVRLGAHWPSDVPAGLAVAVPWVAVVILALRAVEGAGQGDEAPRRAR